MTTFRAALAWRQITQRRHWWENSVTPKAKTLVWNNAECKSLAAMPNSPRKKGSLPVWQHPFHEAWMWQSVCVLFSVQMDGDHVRPEGEYTQPNALCHSEEFAAPGSEIICYMNLISSWLMHNYRDLYYWWVQWLCQCLCWRLWGRSTLWHRSGGGADPGK